MLICYADDTLVVCRGETTTEVEQKINLERETHLKPEWFYGKTYKTNDEEKF